MLFSHRKRLNEIAEAEARGVSFWTNKFDEKLRIRIYHAFSDYAGERIHNCSALARGLIIRTVGKFFLTNANMRDADDFLRHAFSCSDEEFLDVVEAMVQAIRGDQYTSWHTPDEFEKRIRTILREGRVSFDLVEQQMVEFSSMELHTSIIVPTLTLLAGSPKWDRVETPYQNALKEISEGNPADAITDAGTALQQTFELLGCKGDSLGPLIKYARQNSLLAAHDGPMVAGIEKILHWVSADRSENGDSHVVVSPTIEDAWLTVHIVGALILRLTQSPNRGGR